MQRRYEFLWYLVLWIETHRTGSIFFGVCMAQRTSVHEVFCDLSFISCNPWTNLELLDCWRVVSVNLSYRRRLLLDCWVGMILRARQHRVVMSLSICLLFCFDNFHATFVRRLTRNKCWFYLLGWQRICWLCYCSIDVWLGSLFGVLLSYCLVFQINLARHFNCPCTECICFFWDVMLDCFLVATFTLCSWLGYYVRRAFSDDTASSNLFHFFLILVKWIARESVYCISLIGYLLVVLHEKFAHCSRCFWLLGVQGSFIGYRDTNFAACNRVEDPRWWLS